MNSNPIGILDSGIGGVTVLKEILKLLPNENYIYYSDSFNNPYGEKTKEEVINCVEKIIDMFIKNKCKAVVFACNTATALAIDIIREKYPNLIIIGIEPAYKMVHDNANYKKTLVMATPATIESERFLKLYRNYDNGKTILLPCTGLANLIEKGEIKKVNEYLIKYLPKEKIEVVVLGCTHYPLIKDEIRNVLGDVTFYDGGNGVARQLKKLLLENNLISDNSQGSISFYDSSNSVQKGVVFTEVLKK